MDGEVEVGGEGVGGATGLLFFSQWLCLVRVLFCFSGLFWGASLFPVSGNSVGSNCAPNWDELEGYNGGGIVTWKKYAYLDGPDEIFGAVKGRRKV
jgi:hypothetical protein